MKGEDWWVSVTDALPANDRKVLVCRFNGVFTARYTGEFFKADSFSGDIIREVTHWREVPYPPAGVLDARYATSYLPDDRRGE